MDITIQNASVQDMDRLLKMIDGMSDEPAKMPSDDAPMDGGCSICGGSDHDDHSHPHDHDGDVHDHPHDHSGEHDHEHDAPSPCGDDNASMMRKHMGMLASAANDVEEGRHGNAPANTNDGAPDAKGEPYTDYSIRGATKKHHASTISGDNPLEDIKESDMFERYTSFTGRDISKKKDELDEAPPVAPAPNATGAAVQAQQAAQAPNTPAPSPTQGAAPAPAPPDPKVAQQAKQQQVSAQKAVGELATASKELQGHIKTMQTIAPGLGMDIAKDPEIQAMQQLAGNLDAKAKATAAAAKQIPDPAKVAQQAPAGPAPAVAAPAQATA